MAVKSCRRWGQLAPETRAGYSPSHALGGLAGSHRFSPPDTGGENRWLPAKPPKAWDGEYPALVSGANCPQRLHDFTAIEQTFLQDWDDGYMSEDMLKLNVWTPALTGKRPVLVYFHGGGSTFGSSYELPSQEGAQLARHHDAVSVTVNHRLNLLGFLDMSAIDALRTRRRVPP